MNSASSVDLPDWLPKLSYDVLASVAKVLGESSWLVVGALARDYAFRDSEDLHRLRATMDVDLAMLVGSWQEFDQVIERLCVSSGFSHTDTVHRLRRNSRLGLGNSAVVYGEACSVTIWR